MGTCSSKSAPKRMPPAPQPNPLLISIMEAKWDNVGPKERDALRYALYALNVLPYDGPGPTVPDFFVPYDALGDISPYVVTRRMVGQWDGDEEGRTILSSCVAFLWVG